MSTDVYKAFRIIRTCLLAIANIYLLLPALGYGLLYFFLAIYILQHSFQIPLHAYVSRKLEPAALAFESKDYPQAIALLQQFQPESPALAMESTYIKAMCLQASGQCAASHEAYSFIQERTNMDELKMRASLGAALTAARIPSVLREQLYFSDTGDCSPL